MQTQVVQHYNKTMVLLVVYDTCKAWALQTDPVRGSAFAGSTIMGDLMKSPRPLSFDISARRVGNLRRRRYEHAFGQSEPDRGAYNLCMTLQSTSRDNSNIDPFLLPMSSASHPTHESHPKIRFWTYADYLAWKDTSAKLHAGVRGKLPYLEEENGDWLPRGPISEDGTSEEEAEFNDDSKSKKCKEKASIKSKDSNKCLKGSPLTRSKPLESSSDTSLPTKSSCSCSPSPPLLPISPAPVSESQPKHSPSPLPLAGLSGSSSGDRVPAPIKLYVVPGCCWSYYSLRNHQTHSHNISHTPKPLGGLC
ncbi:hypothetical protein BS17DRAFT_767949 [Gyrodon lividus]|nr:hypothetical protein BS17DRAFT_767949 [Gyrodon lividus]